MGKSSCNAPKVVKLYVRLPCKIVDEQQIRNLNSNIVNVVLPRQASRRWCTIEVPESQIESLKQVQIDGKKIKVANVRGKLERGKPRTKPAKTQ